MHSDGLKYGGCYVLVNWPHFMVSWLRIPESPNLQSVVKNINEENHSLLWSTFWHY